MKFELLLWLEIQYKTKYDISLSKQSTITLKMLKIRKV